MRKGSALIISMIFIMLFSSLALAMFAMSSTNARVVGNYKDAGRALNAALSGIECARYIVSSTPTGDETGINYITGEQADTVWSNLCSNLKSKQLGGLSVAEATTFTDSYGSGGQIQTEVIAYADSGEGFKIRFYRYDSDPRTIYAESSGVNDTISRKARISFRLSKNKDVLNYAIAGRGRMWITGDTTIHGDVYSSWDNTAISPFNMTSDSTVEGSFNTVVPWQDMLDAGNYQLQSLECNASGNLILDDNKSVQNNGALVSEDGRIIYDQYGSAIDVYDLAFNNADGEYNVPLDSGGNPIEGFVDDGGGELVSVGTVTYGNPVEARDSSGGHRYGSDDELQGEYTTTNYGQPDQGDIPGLDIADYNTDLYQDLVLAEGGDISYSASASQYTGDLDALGATEGTKYRYEYFPHDAGSYTTGSGLKLKRYIYKDMDFTNVRLPSNCNALFVNCTFNEVLYIDCNKNTSSYYNNVRFDDCTFNGVIVTDTPSALNWQRNCLYFTGAATFQNTSSIPEATILAPHFNVNLGNTSPDQDENNVLKGAIVGGIVDVRGNAQIEGTIISMCDTSKWSSGYVTNIGATLDDGGSETVELGDIGTIEITPDPEQMLPSGITSPIVINVLNATYEEIN